MNQLANLVWYYNVICLWRWKSENVYWENDSLTE